MKRSGRKSASRLRIFLLLFSLLLGVVAVRAQATPTPITIGENKIGQITDTSTPVEFSVSVAAPQSINVQVLAITAGFAPTFQVVDPSGIVILDAANPGTQTIAQGSPSLSSPGSYTIAVKAASSTPGQFLISVQPGAPLAPPTPLTPGTPVNGTVDAQHAREAYSFSGSPTDVLALFVRSASPDSAPVVKISDADSGETLGLINTRLVGSDFRVPAAPGNYLVEVTHSKSASPESFSICLATENGSIPCPGTSTGLTTPTPSLQPTEISGLPTPTVLPPVQTQELDMTPTFSPIQIDPNGACQVASAHGQSINVRSGPGTNFSILTQLQPNMTGLVIGRLADNSWYQVNVGGVLGWVAASVVIIGGNCANVSVVTLPTSVPPSATLTPGDSLTATQMSIDATATQSDALTATTIALTATAAGPGGGGVDFPPGNGAGLTLPAPVIVPFNAQLDFSAVPNSGTVNLTPGVSSDPFVVSVFHTPGIVDVQSYLGNGCFGYATANPDVHINLSQTDVPLLRIYFLGTNGNTSMVVRDGHYGDFQCGNTSFDLVKKIDILFPRGTRFFDVWITSRPENEAVSGTLYITTNPNYFP